MATEVENDLDHTTLFRTLDNYPWDDDEEFQGGLRAILGSVQDPQQVAHLTLRAKCYYYARKANTKVDFDRYRAWVEGQRHGKETSQADDPTSTPVQPNPDITTSAGGIAEAPKPASFAEICDMIAEGKPIPGIKEIPDTILDGQSSQSQASKRRKPWEKSEVAPDTPSWMSS